MRLPAAAIVLAFIVPASAAAQSAAPAPAAAPASAPPAVPAAQPLPSFTKAQLEAGLSLVSQISRTQQQARASMLAALTPGHRALLAQLVGELAVAPQPNPDAAAARLDAALLPAEVMAIGRAVAVQRTDTLAEVGQLKSSMERSATPEQLKQAADANAQAVRALAANGDVPPGFAKMARDAGDPGHVLLQTVLLGVQPFARIFSSMSPR